MNTQVINWEYITINFIKQANRWDKENDINGFLPACIATLKRLTGSYLALQMEFEDAGHVRIKNATPTFLNDLVLNSASLVQLLADKDNKPVYLQDISKFSGVFDAIFPALSSAVIVPIATADGKSLLIFGWSGMQEFDHTFCDFMDIVQMRMKEIIWQSQMQHSLQNAAAKYDAVLESLPVAIVFIGADKANGWINEKAASLLSIPKGKHQSKVLADAMDKMNNTILTKEEINPVTDLLTIVKESQKDVPVNSFKAYILPIHNEHIDGRLWILSEVA